LSHRNPVTESDAPTELVALDPEINFKRMHTVTSTRKLVPPVSKKVSEKSKTQVREKEKRKVKLPYQEFTSQSSQTENQGHRRSRTYKFVHGDGRVDVVTDMMTRKPAYKQGLRRGQKSQNEGSEGDDYLTPSETEPDEPGMSKTPVSKKQISGLRKHGEARTREFGVDTTANLPVYYSSNKGHKKSRTNGNREGQGQREVSR